MVDRALLLELSAQMLREEMGTYSHDPDSNDTETPQSDCASLEMMLEDVLQELSDLKLAMSMLLAAYQNGDQIRGTLEEEVQCTMDRLMAKNLREEDEPPDHLVVIRAIEAPPADDILSKTEMEPHSSAYNQEDGGLNSKGKENEVSSDSMITLVKLCEEE
ncbi:hypothetical protein BDK51DRAFT_46467 [Blyttiomyces helicus]|uniref:Uncharacterized protein n=1 Tax=Blyttiomyces helicus TaxID=388810 RepID=A0A4P9WHJ2_9FUNG|nr:hypothetical protein BDK51DRAFT_46467 [Blyttiomyces helicus]|eukprot:RKO92301.1 hypothetical protein BDK51DRAFT_46467 [Blyttiomyces helicus]